ncbi:MAG: SIMPL domain-containing protein, partial [bacterium]
ISISPKTWQGLAWILGVFLLALTAKQLVGIFKETKEYNQPEHTITISAEGKVLAKPDVVKIQLSVVTEGKTATEVSKQGTEQYNAIVAAVKKLGVKAEDIKTSGYYLNPRYRYEQPSGKSFIDGYELRQSLEVKVRDLDKTGEIIAAATKAGANQVGDFQLTVDDQEKLMDEARLKAIAKAKEKGEAIAKAAGVELGEIVNFSENGGQFPPIYYGRGGMMEAKDESLPVPDIQYGSQEITANVSVTFVVE